jgi:hypothetical protein
MMEDPMAEDRIPIAPADPRRESVEPVREKPAHVRRSKAAGATGGDEEIRLCDLTRRGSRTEEQGPPGKTHTGASGTTSEPWTNAARAKRR